MPFQTSVVPCTGKVPPATGAKLVALVLVAASLDLADLVSSVVCQALLAGLLDNLGSELLDARMQACPVPLVAGSSATPWVICSLRAWLA